MNKQDKNILKLLDMEIQTDAVADSKEMHYIDVVNFQLREPATNIFASLPLLAESINSQETEKALETLQSIYKKSYQLIKSINNMTLSAKLLGNREFSKEIIDFSSLVKSVFESSSLVLPDYYSLEIYTEAGCTIEGNAKLMTIALFNLIANSFDYRMEDDVKVSVNLKSENGKNILVYRDNSIGVKPELAQDIFKPYFTSNPYNDGEPYDKMGLGLYVLQQAVHKAGGTVFLQTEFSEGVNVVISIPEIKDGETKIIKSSPKEFVLNKYSEMYVQLCGYCTLPDLI